MSHLVKVLVTLSLEAVHVAVVETVREREGGTGNPPLPGHVVALVLHYLLHETST